MKVIESKLVGHLWPNGEFSCGRVKETSEHPFDGALEVPRLSPSGEFCVTEFLDRVEVGGGGPAASPGLDKPPQKSQGRSKTSDSEACRRGSKGLTRYGAKMIRNSCHLIDEAGSPGCQSFATLTLPDMKDCIRRELMREWSHITRVFFQRMSRFLVGRSLPGEIAYVVEIQTKRLEKEGRAIPHLHCVFQSCPVGKPEKWMITPKEIGDIWREVVSTVVPDSVPYWKNSHWNLKGVGKHTIGYMSKYLSKGTAIDKSMKDEIYRRHPVKSWWGAVGGLKKRVQRAKMYLDTSECLMVMDQFRSKESESDFAYGHDIYLDLDRGAKIWIGFCTKISGDTLSFIREYHSCLSLTVA